MTTTKPPHRTVAYLDILGFKSYTLIDTEGAANLLLNYHQIINTKLADMTQFPASGYEDPALRKLAERGEIGSFEMFLPFSDSIFVVSTQPDTLLRQLSRFMIDSFALTSDAFAHPETIADPTAVTITELSSSAVAAKRPARWFPLLFRGGIAYGDVVSPRITAVVDFSPTRIVNLAGTAVVNAVGLEKTGKGPRLFCKTDFRDQLAVDSHGFLAQVSGDALEILWPAFLYHDWNSPHVEINHFGDLFLPAVNLWRAFRAQPEVEPHYLEFLKPIVMATLKTFDRHGCLDLALDHVKERIISYGVEALSDQLMPKLKT